MWMVKIELTVGNIYLTYRKSLNGTLILFIFKKNQDKKNEIFKTLESKTYFQP